jgi:hypothetical protein
MHETDLYPPVKALLESQGYTVKGEVGALDVMGVRGEEDPVVVELKTGFSLSLFHQAIARQAISDVVYVAVPHKKSKASRSALKRNTTLCRRLGLGLILVRLSDGHTQVVCDPAPYSPRKNLKRKARLLREFARMEGDPNTGGSTRENLMTAYRSDALRCQAYLQENGPSKAMAVAKGAEVPTARNIMADNHYGWFERVSRGVYGLSELGLT